MVFDAIYDTFVKIVDSKMKDKNVDDEIFGDMVLKEMAKALTVAIYRNGTIEDVHAGEGFGARTFEWDYIHMLVSIPPKLSVSSFMGYLKGKSALMIFDLSHKNLGSNR